MASGIPLTFHPTKLIMQDHVRSRSGLRHRETVGEFLIGHPPMGSEPQVANIWQDRWRAAKADRRPQCRHRRRGVNQRSSRHKSLAVAHSARARAAAAAERCFSAALCQRVTRAVPRSAAAPREIWRRSVVVVAASSRKIGALVKTGFAAAIGVSRHCFTCGCTVWPEGNGTERLLALVRQAFKAIGEFEQGGHNVHGACGRSHAAIHRGMFTEHGG
jgi:hypothetical protein